MYKRTVQTFASPNDKNLIIVVSRCLADIELFILETLQKYTQFTCNNLTEYISKLNKLIEAYWRQFHSDFHLSGELNWVVDGRVQFTVSKIACEKFVIYKLFVNDLVGENNVILWTLHDVDSE